MSSTALVPWKDYIPADEGMERWYLSYTVSTLLQRAIPDVRDGLKPVHRRILYSMHELDLTQKAAHKKSARVVGDVIGKYHPHGDASVYEAMTLMAQDFSLRHPLIDGQGNWGSIDGDSAAAMRYTECRMTGLAQLLLSEIDLGTVDFRPNYDGNDFEPVCMPARVPAILLNDQMGIAVSMASDIPGHNLAEVCAAAETVLLKPDATLREILKSIKGPDFAGGGQVISQRSDLVDAYETGRGSIAVRCRWEVRQDADGWHVAVIELPPKVSPEKVLLEIEELSNPQPKKGKKPGENAGLTAEQKASSREMLSRVASVNNGAGQDTGPVCIEIHPRSKRQDAEEMMGYLCAVTSLEARTKVNMCIVGLDGRPRQMGLLEILRDWCAFRVETVTRRTKARLEKVEARIHVLEGLAKILLDIDEVIREIRASETDVEAKHRLMARWTLSGIQADRVLDMRLRQITKLDSIAIEKELEALRGEQDVLMRLLGDRNTLLQQVASELRADAEMYGSERRTMVKEAEVATFVEKIVDDPLTIIVSRKGWLRARTGHGVDLESVGYKDGDKLLVTIETRSSAFIVFMDHNGRAYTVAAADIPGGKGDGIPLASLVEIQNCGRIVSAFPATGKERVLLSSTIGYGFLTTTENLMGRVKAGKAVVNVKGGEILPPILLASDDDMVLAASTAGNALVFPLSEVLEYPKGQGCKLLSLKNGEELRRVMVYSKGITLPALKGPIGDVDLSRSQLDEYIRNRGARGKLLPKSVAVGKL